MEWLNRLIMAVDEAGLRNDAYGMINSFSNICAYIFGFLHGRKLKAGFFAVILAVVAERYLVGPLMSVILYIENGFEPTNRANAVVVYSFVPLIGWIMSKILRRSWKEMWDIMMPIPLVMFAGARVACTITGCCRGYPCSWGVYNAIQGATMFPIQLLESLVTILILVVVLRREKRNRFATDGRNAPIILISYGILRFFLEFLHDNPKTVAGLATMQFHCLIMIAVGVITLCIIKQSEQKTKHLSIEKINTPKGV